jgi:hypothetical protein
MSTGPRGPPSWRKQLHRVRRQERKVKSSAEAEEGDATNTRSANGIRLDRMHMQNFIDAIRTGSPLSSPIAEGHKSVAMLHLGNIAQRVGRPSTAIPRTGTSSMTRRR